MKKLNLQDLTIEITRQCNMSCSHCLRGEPENVNINIKHVDKLFSKLEHIGDLTITGGEPSLHPEIIDQIVESLKKHNVSLDTFYLVTNAKKVTNEFMISVLNLYSMCDAIDEEFYGGLAISGDGYHDRLNAENVQRLKAFSFTSVREPNEERFDDNLINQGRSVDNYPSIREVNIYACEIEDNYISETGLYLNCLGDLLPDGNLSYDTQREENLIIANVQDKGFNLLNALKRFNKRIDEGKTVEELIDLEIA